MERRAFLASLAAGAFAVAAPGSRAVAAPAGPGLAGPAPLFENRRLTPLRGFAGQDIACDGLAIEGTLPADLRGTFFRNGPGLFERGGERYRHPFDGDGLVHAYRFTDAGVSHRARFVRTGKFVAEARAGKFLVGGFGTGLSARMPITGPDNFNTANTSVLMHQGKLLALWEGGSAHALDPATLETIGPVTFRRDLAKMPFSAHPKVEPDGTTWNFGAAGDRMLIYQFAPDGTLVRAELVESGPMGMVHDFAVTERHLVFLLPPVTFDMAAFRAGKPITESMVWHPDRPTRVVTFEKADLRKRREYLLEAFSFFHFGNAWEDAQGVIRADFVRSDDLSLMNEWMPKMMAGEFAHAPRSDAAFLTADPSTGKATVEIASGQCEFPVVDPRVVGRRYRQVFHPMRLGPETADDGFDAIVRTDPETGRKDTYRYDAGMIVEEHIVVPKPGTSTEGAAWLLGAGFDVRRQQSFVTVFDAASLAAGPVALARLPYWVPSCFHGRWS